ncbi:DUF5959 family protein [Kitasatospora sp. NPDC092039]|uniref:DUF5959 family protein n=1 Tax=Kitasatospora sp. NPDC092039 TaxID=3364086 RepID=UPI0037F3A7A4
MINLGDGDNSLRVRVSGRRSPGVPHRHDLPDAEVLVTSGFVSGRLATVLSPSDLESWARALDRLAEGQDVCWKDDDHSPEIRIQPYDETTSRWCGLRYGISSPKARRPPGTGTARRAGEGGRAVRGCGAGCRVSGGPGGR